MRAGSQARLGLGTKDDADFGISVENKALLVSSVGSAMSAFTLRHLSLNNSRFITIANRIFVNQRDYRIIALDLVIFISIKHCFRSI